MFDSHETIASALPDALGRRSLGSGLALGVGGSDVALQRAAHAAIAVEQFLAEI